MTTIEAATADEVLGGLSIVDCDAHFTEPPDLWTSRALASKKDHELLGATEFEIRDRVHKLGAHAIETALNERKKGGTKGRA